MSLCECYVWLAWGCVWSELQCHLFLFFVSISTISYVILLRDVRWSCRFCPTSFSKPMILVPSFAGPWRAGWCPSSSISCSVSFWLPSPANYVCLACVSLLVVDSKFFSELEILFSELLCFWNILTMWVIFLWFLDYIETIWIFVFCNISIILTVSECKCGSAVMLCCSWTDLMWLILVSLLET